MKDKKKILYRSLFMIFLIGILLWLNHNVTFLDRQYKTMSGRLLKETITIKELKQALEEENKNNKQFQEIILWKQGTIEEIYNPTLKNKVTLPITIVYGSMEATTPMELIHGNYVFKRDKYGCVIDTETAYELFQDTNVVGNMIRCNEKEYQIRGIVKTERPVFLRQSIEEDKEEFAQLEFWFKKDLENKLQSAKLFLDQYGKGEYAVFIDGILYRTVVERFSTLPYWLISACMIVTARKFIVKRKQRFCFKNMIFIIFILIYILSIYYYIGNPFYIPAEWIPTKWSDFEFWTAKWEETIEQTEKIRYLVPNTKDVMLMDIFYKSLFGILSSIIMILESVRRMLKEV